MSVKASNAALGDGLEEALSKGEKFKSRIGQLETEMETMRVIRPEFSFEYFIIFPQNFLAGNDEREGNEVGVDYRPTDETH